MSGGILSQNRIPASYLRSISPYARYMKSNLSFEEYCAAIEKDPDNFRYIPTKNRTKELCLFTMDRLGFSSIEEWVKNKYQDFPYVTPELFTEESCLLFVASPYYSDYESGDWDMGIPYSGKGKIEYLKYRDFMRWESVCQASVRKKSITLAGVPIKWITEELCEIAFHDNIMNLKNMPFKYRTKERCIEAVQAFGTMLQYVPVDKLDANMCKNALMESVRNVHYIPKRFRTLDILSIGAKKWDFFLFELNPEDISLDLCRVAVQAFPNAIKYVPEDMKKLL